MLKYVVYSCKRGEDTVNLAVPYKSEKQLRTLLVLLTAEDRSSCSDTAKDFYETLLDTPDMGDIVDLAGFTHFVRSY